MISLALLCGNLLSSPEYWDSVPNPAGYFEILWGDFLTGRSLATAKVSPTFSKAAGSRNRVPGRTPQSAKHHRSFCKKANRFINNPCVMQDAFNWSVFGMRGAPAEQNFKNRKLVFTCIGSNMKDFTSLYDAKFKIAKKFLT